MEHRKLYTKAGGLSEPATSSSHLGRAAETIKSRGHEPEQIPTTSECGHHLLQIVTKLKQGADAAAEEAGWKAADPGRYPQQVCRGLARLLSQGKVDSESAWRQVFPQGGEQCGWREDAVDLRAL